MQRIHLKDIAAIHFWTFAIACLPSVPFPFRTEFIVISLCWWIGGLPIYRYFGAPYWDEFSPPYRQPASGPEETD